MTNLMRAAMRYILGDLSQPSTRLEHTYADLEKWREATRAAPEQKLQVGDKVVVIDQAVPTSGTVIKVSDWQDVVGPPGTGTCYLIHFEEYGIDRWLDTFSMTPAENQQ